MRCVVKDTQIKYTDYGYNTNACVSAFNIITITKNAVLNKFIQNKRTFQTHVFKSEKRKVSLLAARTVQFIYINVLYQIAGAAFSRWYEEIKKL